MSRIMDFIDISRCHQYLKNTFVLAPLLFGHKLTDPVAVIDALMAFCAFCLAASAVYVFNDVRDIQEDRQHPSKRLRPLARGRIEAREAYIFSTTLCIASIVLSISLSLNFTIIILVYFALNIFYSIRIKHLALLDIITIAFNFVLRVIAGAVVINVVPSHWLILTTFLLALFLALAKRRDDLLLTDRGINTRNSLDGYNFEFISSAMMVMASVIIVSYIMYTVSPGVVEKHGSNNLYLTSFFVIIGLLRYMQITFVKEKSGSPTRVVIRDLFLQIVICLWLLSFLFLIHVDSF